MKIGSVTTSSTGLILVTTVFAASCGLILGVVWGRVADDKVPLRTQVLSWDQARVVEAEWGQMRYYFRGETAMTNNALVAVAVVRPGKAVHRAHRHAEEEYLLLISGEGTWQIGDKQFPAKKGDILYAEPWVYHGLVNTGDEPLIFAVVRYLSKGIAVPPQPDSRPDEL